MQIDLPAVDLGEHRCFSQPWADFRRYIICSDGLIELFPAAVGEGNCKHWNMHN